MVNITLKQLRYFDALARHEHFGRAAEASSISQPALSVQIRELEEALGLALVERGPRHITLTAFGAEALGRARHILKSVEDLGDLARASSVDFGGQLRLGVIPTIAPYLLPRLIGQLSRKHPGLDVQIRETITPNLIADLSEGRIDAAIVALPVSEVAFVETALFDEEIVLVRHLSEAGQPVPDRKALARQRLLLLEEGHCFRDQALDLCSLSGSERHSGLDGSSLSTLVQMVGAGIGMTLVPAMAVDVETRTAKVEVRSLSDPRPHRKVGMIWRKSSPLGAQLAGLADLVTSLARPDGEAAAP